MQAGLGTFTHILAYSGMFRKYSAIFRILCNPDIFRMIVYSKSKPKAYSEPCQTSTIEHFVKIVNSYPVVVFTN